MDHFFLIVVSPGKRASIEEYLIVADSMAPLDLFEIIYATIIQNEYIVLVKNPKLLNWCGNLNFCKYSFAVNWLNGDSVI